MNILIVSATTLEIEAFLCKYNFIQKSNLYSFQLKEHQIDCLVAGIGMVATTFELTKQLVTTDYELIINVGIAGSFSSKLSIGEVVEVKTEQFADLGIDDNGTYYSVFDAKLQHANEFPFLNEKLCNTNEYSFLKQITKVNGITVNTVSGSKSSIDRICTKYNPDTESMEGAAVFFVALQSKINFVQLRAISNMVEPRNKKKWNISLAITNLNSTLIDIFESFYFKK